MLSKKMLDALNDQINAELYSSYLYLAMAGNFEGLNLKGFAKWMRVQSKEEYGHAMKFFDYIHDRMGQVKLLPIDAPPKKWTPLEAFKDVCKHEAKVTGLINNLMDLAHGENDHATGVLLQWYINEQVEEESSANSVLATLEAIKDSAGGLYMLDHQLSKRGEK